MSSPEDSEWDKMEITQFDAQEEQSNYQDDADPISHEKGRSSNETETAVIALLDHHIKKTCDSAGSLGGDMIGDDDVNSSNLCCD